MFNFAQLSSGRVRILKNIKIFPFLMSVLVFGVVWQRERIGLVGLLWGVRRASSGWRRFGPWRTMLMMLRRLKLLLDHKIRLHPPLPTPSNDSYCSRVPLPAPPNPPPTNQPTNKPTHHQPNHRQKNFTRYHQIAIPPAEQHDLTRKLPQVAFLGHV